MGKLRLSGHGVALFLVILATTPFLVAPARQRSQAEALATMTAKDPTLMAYFGDKPFREHGSIRWLLTNLNMSYPGLEEVSSAALEGNEFKVRCSPSVSRHSLKFRLYIHYATHTPGFTRPTPRVCGCADAPTLDLVVSVWVEKKEEGGKKKEKKMVPKLPSALRYKWALLLTPGLILQVSSNLLQYFRKRTKAWRLLKNFGENIKSQEVADLAVENTVTKLGGASKPRLVKFGPGGIEWQHNPYWETEKDGEWAWALHRQPFWMSMAWAYRASGDEKYALAWRRQMMSWIDMNPRDTRYDYDWGKRFTLDSSRRHPVKFEGGKVWPNPVHPEMSWAWRRIDAGKRGIQFPVLLLNFINSPHFTPGLLITVLNSIHEHGEFLANNPFRPFTRDNHGLYEAEGSASLGILFPEFKSAKLWRDRSFDLLQEEIKKELRPDGLQVENVMSYQMGCLRIFTDSYMLAKKNKLNAFPPWYMTKIRKLVSAIELVSFPDGRAPHFGDLGASISTNNALKSWFRHFGMERRPHHAQASIALRWSGMFNIRSNWTENASMLLMRCGPSYNAHSHKDAGTFSLFAGGRILLPDSGCFTYTGIKDTIPTDPDRRYFQGTSAHNTLTLDNADAHLPSLQHGPYRTLKGYDDCGVMLWQPEDFMRRTQLVVENRKTYRDPDLSHRRAVLELSGGKGFIVIDEAIGEASGTVSTKFHFLPADVETRPENHAMWSATPGKVNVLVQGMEQVGMTMRPHTSRMSESMGTSVPRSAVAFEISKKAGTHAVRFVTMILLFDGTAPPQASVDVFGDFGGTIITVEARINGISEKLNYEVDPERMQMSPPPSEFDLLREADYIPFYNNFMPTQHVGVSTFPERVCKRDDSVSSATSRCSPPVMLSAVEKDKRLSPVVSKEGNYLYCGIPKCGVSRWRRLSRRVAGIAEWADKNAHSPVKNGLTYLADFSDAEAHELINSASLYSFIIVRSPYARLLSGWLDKRDFANFNLPQNFSDFVKWVEPQAVKKLNEHWKPISSFCGIEHGMQFDLVARLEEIDDWGPELVKRTGIEAFVDNGWGGGFFRSDGDGVAHNHRSEQRLKEFYTPQLMRIVERIYKKDFDRFGYTIGQLL